MTLKIDRILCELQCGNNYSLGECGSLAPKMGGCDDVEQAKSALLAEIKKGINTIPNWIESWGKDMFPVSDLKKSLGIEEKGKEKPYERGRYRMATKALHLTGDISRDNPELCIIFGEDGDNYIGNWVEGLGFVKVKFQKKRQGN